MALQDMAMPTAPGPPAMFAFLNEAVMDHLKDGLDLCYSSIFTCQRFYCCDLECRRQSISALHTENLCDLPLTQTAQYFFPWQLSITYL